MITLTYTPSTNKIVISGTEFWAGLQNDVQIVNSEHATSPINTGHTIVLKLKNRTDRSADPFISFTDWSWSGDTGTGTINANVSALLAYLGNENDAKSVLCEIKDDTDNDIIAFTTEFFVYNPASRDEDIAEATSDTWQDWVRDLVASMAFYDYDSDNTSGLTFAYKAGVVRQDETVNTTSAGTVTLTDDDTNYVEVNTNGTVSANTTGFTSGSLPLYTVVCSDGGIDTVTDKRTWFSRQDLSSYDTHVAASAPHSGHAVPGEAEEVASLPAAPVAGRLYYLTAADDTANAPPGVYVHTGAGWICHDPFATYDLGDLGATPDVSLIPGVHYTANVNVEVMAATFTLSEEGGCVMTISNPSTLAFSQPEMAERTAKTLGWDAAGTSTLFRGVFSEDGTYFEASAAELT